MTSQDNIVYPSTSAGRQVVSNAKPDLRWKKPLLKVHTSVSWVKVPLDTMIVEMVGRGKHMLLELLRLKKISEEEFNLFTGI